jgi:hypothetical protein
VLVTSPSILFSVGLSSLAGHENKKHLRILYYYAQIIFSRIAKYNDDISRSGQKSAVCLQTFPCHLQFKFADVQIFHFFGELLMVCGYLTSSNMLISTGEAKTTTWCGHVAPRYRLLRLSAHYLLKLDIGITYNSY